MWPKSYTNEILVRWCVQVTTKTWRQGLEKAEMYGIAKMLASYIWYNEEKGRLFIFSKRLQGFSSLKQLTPILSLGSPRTKRQGVDEHGYSPFDLMDDFIVLLRYSCSKILNFSFRTTSVSWSRINGLRSRSTSLNRKLCSWCFMSFLYWCQLFQRCLPKITSESSRCTWRGQ